jgi:hypothetical protein
MDLDFIGSLTVIGLLFICVVYLFIPFGKGGDLK